MISQPLLLLSAFLVCVLRALRETSHGQLLHRPADLRHRPRPADAPDRRHLPVRPADLAVSRHRPAPGPDHRHLHRRRCPDRLRLRHHPDRAEGQRRQGHDLHVLRQHQQRRLADPRHLRRRLPPGHRRRRRPEQGRHRQAHPSARGHAGRRREQEDADEHGLRRQPRQPRGHLRPELPRQLRPDQRRRCPQAHSRASATSTSSAASTRCGSGSTRTGWPTSRSPRGGHQRHQVGEPPGRRRQDRRAAGAAGQRFEYPVTAKGRLELARSSRTSSSAPGPTARSSASATSPASSWAPKPTTRPATSAASPPPRSRSTSSSDANALQIVEQVQRRDGAARQDFPPDLEYRIAFDTTKYVQENINEVEHTLIEAFVLVLIVVFLFLQGFRTTLIPMIAIPVSLVAPSP